MGTYTRYLIPALVLLAVAFAAGHWIRDRHTGEPDNVLALAPDLSCNLRAGPCRLPLPDGGAVVLDILPRSLEPMAPLQLEVRVSDAPLEARWVEFAGINMDMGFNRASLTPRSPGQFTGSGMIPVCVSDRMVWEARVMLAGDGDWISAPFRFDVVRN
jgi:hypothetical protein